jgi:hypothetical protein
LWDEWHKQKVEMNKTRFFIESVYGEYLASNGLKRVWRVDIKYAMDFNSVKEAQEQASRYGIKNYKVIEREVDLESAL